MLRHNNPRKPLSSSHLAKGVVKCYMKTSWAVWPLLLILNGMTNHVAASTRPGPSGTATAPIVVRMTVNPLSRVPVPYIHAYGDPTHRPSVDRTARVRVPRCGETYRLTHGPSADRCRVALSENSGGAILHRPSVSEYAIWRALWSAHSPLSDQRVLQDGKTCSEYLWDAAVVMGVDPAVVMGFFKQESSYGMAGVARYTHALSNQRPSANTQPVIVTYDGEYRYFNDWFQGIDAVVALLHRYAMSGMPTIDAAVPVYAPVADGNNPASYAATVHAVMGSLHNFSARGQ